MKKVAVVLSGCGVFDGAEIHESVLTLLALDRKNADIRMFAPDTEQMEVINHISGESTGEIRNVLVESARIARGNIKNLKQANIEDLDAVIFPGGYGVAKNLSNFAVKGTGCGVNPEVQEFIVKCLNERKVMGFICIAPALLAKISGDLGMNIDLTIGTDPETAQAVETMGGHHIPCSVNEIVIDEENRIVTTPAYMLGQRIVEVATGIEKLVDKVLQMC